MKLHNSKTQEEFVKDTASTNFSRKQREIIWEMISSAPPRSGIWIIAQEEIPKNFIAFTNEFQLLYALSNAPTNYQTSQTRDMPAFKSEKEAKDYCCLNLLKECGGENTYLKRLGLAVIESCNTRALIYPEHKYIITKLWYRAGFGKHGASWVPSEDQICEIGNRAESLLMGLGMNNFRGLQREVVSNLVRDYNITEEAQENEAFALAGSSGKMVAVKRYKAGDMKDKFIMAWVYDNFLK